MAIELDPDPWNPQNIILSVKDCAGPRQDGRNSEAGMRENHAVEGALTLPSYDRRKVVLADRPGSGAHDPIISNHEARVLMFFQVVRRYGRQGAALLLGLMLLAGTAIAQQTGGTWRIEVLRDLSLEDAQRAQALLESTPESKQYGPVILDRQGNTYRVLMGMFPGREQAQAAFNYVQEHGITAQQIVQADQFTPPPANTNSGYSVFLSRYTSQEETDRAVEALTNAGFTDIRIVREGRFQSVYVGNGQLRDAQRILGQLRQLGLTVDRVTAVRMAPSRTAGAQTTTVAPSPGGGQRAPGRPAGLSQSVLESDRWKSLTPQEQELVLENLDIAASVRSGDAVAGKVIDIDKRLEALSSEVRGLIQRIETEADTTRKMAEEQKKLVDAAENLQRSGSYEEAIVRLQEAMNIDKEDTLRQRRMIQTRINALQSLLSGETYPGQNEANEKLKAQLEAQIDQLLASGRLEDKSQALLLMRNVYNLNPTKYEAVYGPKIQQLADQIAAEEKARTDAPIAETSSLRLFVYGLAAGVVVLLLLVLMGWLRSRKQHKELITRLHDITSASIRPMRELDASVAPMLEASVAGSGTESDIFSPRAPKAPPQGQISEDVLGDPLAGLSSPAPAASKKGKDKKAGKKGEAEPQAAPASDMNDLDALFGESPSVGGAVTKNLGGSEPPTVDMNFDDIFGAPETGASKSTPPPAAEHHDDDVFGSFFAGQANEKKDEQVSSPHTVPHHAMPTDSGAISFEDLLGGHDEGHSSDKKLATDDTDLLAIFDTSPAEDQGKPASDVEERFKDSPFASLMGGESTKGSESVGLSSKGGLEDNTEIPAIKLDDTDLPAMDARPANGGSLNLGDGPDSEDTNTAISFEGFAGAGPARQSANGSGGIELDFEDDEISRPPAGWDGAYEFASLTVKSDTPPRGSQQYLCFEKREGAGKALYSRAFPAISGVVGIEFDLRCNDKNKFLLGLYIEKDGDFQQAIHTKILRSEAQTTPTIHMQGESAPYLLGSWAHIKYVVDLDNGKLNSYIDNTHVGRDVPLDPNPGILNTLSIRDNINTTGVLLIDNIKVYKIK